MDEPLDDRELLRGVARGDAVAFEAVVDQYESALIRYAQHVTGRREPAEDTVQEAFVALLRLREGAERIDSLSAWLFRVTRNRALDLMKKESRMRQREGAAAIAEVIPPPECPTEAREEEQLVVEQIALLDRPTREVLLLKIREDHSYREISEITGLSLGQVSKLIHRGLGRIARALRNQGATRS